MCGIFGVYSWRNGIHNTHTLCALTNTLQHRGPDDGAYWTDNSFFFGHRRLAIIDLVHGIQPMATHDGLVVVTFNGEIYNYIELRALLEQRGYVFSTNSDTEVLLHGFVEWGTRLPERLTGMFAFAIADRRDRSLFLARDPFGEKPLFLFETAEGVTFSSEVRALAALPTLSAAVDGDALARYLCLNYAPGEHTLLAGVRRLKPGNWRLYDSAGKTREETYWSPHGAATSGLDGATVEAAAEKLGQRIDNAVAIALRSDVPVGLFLSGGMDSALVAESAVRQGVLDRAFCLDFAESTFSEWHKARLVAIKLGLPLTRVVLSCDVMEDFLSIVAHADDPLADSSALAVWTLAREAARHQKVVISGDGGDELFAGYLTYKATLAHKYFARLLPGWARRGLAGLGGLMPTTERKVSASYKLMRYLRAADLPPAQAHFAWNGAWMPEEAASLLLDENAQETAAGFLAHIANQHNLPNEPALTDLQRADAEEYLPNDILTKVDRMSMAHGLEVRAPLLNPDVARFAFGLPDRLKLSPASKPKMLLRALAEKKYGPQISTAAKQGFSIPIHAWLRGPARYLVDDLLSTTSVEKTGMLRSEVVESVKNQHMSGRRSLGYELWGLMVFVAWHRARVETKPTACPADLKQLSFGAETRQRYLST
ncbi:MAG: asparagine synthase (glutamine-hydrolyzing) [Gammaproteobacteria bacterium]